MMVGEAFAPSGALAVGGVVAFAVGSLFLFSGDAPGFELSWTVVASATAVSLALFAIALAAVWRSHRRTVATGDAALVGSAGEVVRWDDQRRRSAGQGRTLARHLGRAACARPARAHPRAPRSDFGDRAGTLRTQQAGASHVQHADRRRRLHRNRGDRRRLPLFRHPHPARIRARGDVHARPLLGRARARPHSDDPDHPADGAHGPAHHRARRAEPGRDLARQRLGQGQRGGVFPRGRSRQGGDPGGGLLQRHQPAGADHAALGARQARARRDAGRARQAQPSTSSTSSMRRPTPGASRSPMSRSSTSTSTKA